MPETVTVNIYSSWDRTNIVFSAEVDAAIPVSSRIKAAVLIAVGQKADLIGSDLRGSDLSGSDLIGSDLIGSDLRGSDLSGSNLSGSDLSRSDLFGSDLSGSNLSGSDLSGSDLSWADLRGSDLRGSDLRGADLRGADLSWADLRGSNLHGSDLSGSDLRGSDLSGSDLSSFKQDFLAEVLRMPNELEALRNAIVAGRIDGSTYGGECACLAGTIAKARGLKDYEGDDIGDGPTAFHASGSSPREIWFAAIRVGDTPETNPAAAAALAWTDEAIAVRDMIRRSAVA